MTFNKWLETFINEKNLDTEHTFEIEGQSGLNLIPLGALVEHINVAPAHEQAAIKNTLVKIDFHNGDPLHFFAHLAQAIAL
jgi:hypothetical protein